MGLSHEEYRDSIPSRQAQQLLAALFIERAQVLDAMVPLSVVGMIDSGEVLAEVIARRLKRMSCTIPIIPLFDGNDTIRAAGSGLSTEITLGEFEPDSRDPATLHSTLEESRARQFSDIRRAEACAAWPKITPELAQTTVLLVDSVMVYKPKFAAALRLLTQSGITKIVTLSALVYSPVLFGNTVPLKAGIFLKRFSKLDELRSEVQQLNSMSEQDIKKRYPTP